MNLPELNKTYNYFDDGKIRESRRFPVTIVGIIPFDKADSNLLDDWKAEVFWIDWLYAKTTDYFIKGVIKEDTPDYKQEFDVIFARTIDGGWFSLGWWSGRLDVDGSLTKMLGESTNG